MADVDRTLIVLSTDDLVVTGNPLIAGQSGRSLALQRLLVTIGISAAQTWTFQTTSGTVIAVLPASAPTGSVIVFIISTHGLDLGVGQGLKVVASAAGVQGCIVAEGVTL